MSDVFFWCMGKGTPEITLPLCKKDHTSDKVYLLRVWGRISTGEYRDLHIIGMVLRIFRLYVVLYTAFTGDCFRLIHNNVWLLGNMLNMETLQPMDTMYKIRMDTIQHALWFIFDSACLQCMHCSETNAWVDCPVLLEEWNWIRQSFTISS